MNEPHDLDIKVWASTCQKAVTAIREAGATKQMILLPGTGFSSAGEFVSSGSGDALIEIKNPDGSTDGLILDVHKYLDEDNSGTHAECVTNNTDAFGSVAEFLRKNNRKAIVSETGAAPGEVSCMMQFCLQNAFINANADVYLGLVGWAAGSFDSSYLLSLTPTQEGGKWVDNPLLAQCLVGAWMASSEPGDTLSNGGTSSVSTLSGSGFASASASASASTTSGAVSTPGSSTSGPASRPPLTETGTWVMTLNISTGRGAAGAAPTTLIIATDSVPVPSLTRPTRTETGSPGSEPITETPGGPAQGSAAERKRLRMAVVLGAVVLFGTTMWMC